LKCSVNSPQSQEIFASIAHMFNHLAEDVYVNSHHLQKVRALADDSQARRMILMPEAKSILDPYLMYFIQAIENVPLGFSFGRTQEAGTDPVMSEKLR